jgi:hypothetical protein
MNSEASRSSNRCNEIAAFDRQSNPAGQPSFWQASILLLAFLLCSGNALAQLPLNTQSNYAGAEAGSWGGPEGGVTGPADGACRNMGAVGKISLLNTFGFNIPGDATILAVRAQIKSGENAGQDVAIALASDATVEPPVLIGDIKSFFAPASGGDCSSTVVVEVGGDANTFWNTGGGLTPAVVNSPSFGIAMTKTQTSSVKVDAICLEMDYTTPTGPDTQELCFDATPETASLTIVKTVEGAAAGSDWGFSRNNPDVNFTLPAAGGQQVYAALPAGTYDVLETLQSGYSATVQCGEAGDPTTPIGSAIGDGTTNLGRSVTLAVGDNVTCVFVNTEVTSFTVIKDFSDDNLTPVDITLTCSDGTVTTNPVQATDAEPAVFEITGVEDPASVTCTATEGTLPVGYTADDSDCQDDDPLGSTCTILNTANEGTFTVRKTYSDGATDPVDVTVTCDAPAEVLSNPLQASPSVSAVFNVTRVTDGVTTCSATEAVPAGYTVDDTDCNDGDLINSGCELANSLIPQAASARFTVEKVFADGNDVTPVTFTIDCNTGLILDQTKTADVDPGPIGDPSSFEVEFVVTDFDQGELDCTVSEDPVPTGYSPSYECDSNSLGTCDTGDESDLDDYFEGPCVYNDVDTSERLDEEESWQHLCVVRNYPDPVEVVVSKVWEFAGNETHGIDPYYVLTLTCNNEIVTEGAVDGGDGWWSISFTNESGTADAEYSALVIPDWDGGTDCEVYESGQDSAVEVDNGCSSLLAELGDGDECTIVNTVFYEGIPTLSQYGLALLALLMLGVGMVGFRRFA